MTQPKMKRAENLDEILRVFTPEPLEGDNLSEFFYEGTMKSRMGNSTKSPIRRLYKDCTSPSSKNAHLLLGHGGCGKSTELRDLERRFNDAKYPVHMVHARSERDLEKIDRWDIMMLITEGLCQIAEGHKVSIPNYTLKALYAILYNEMIQEETISDSNSVKLAMGAEIKTPPLGGIIKAFASLGGELKTGSAKSTTIKEVMDKRASEWRMHTEIIAEEIWKKCKNKHPIIIIEDLDRLPDTDKIFSILSYSVLSEMSFPVIYTFPISRRYDSRFPALLALYKDHPLPMIKVANHYPRNENEEGMEVIRTIVEKRADLCLFDKSDDVLNELIRKTGGSLRHLFECIIIAAEEASSRGAHKIELQDADSALSEKRDGLTRILDTKMSRKLAIIYDDQKARRRYDDKEFLLDMMHALVVLEYQNGYHWHDVHPLVVDYLYEMEEIPSHES